MLIHVEVYFEGFGWIPFEPTPSFTNNASPATGTVSSTTNESQSTTSESTTVNSTKKQKRLLKALHKIRK
ncbi:hypothetical protein GQR36_20925 [Enterococcus termitis]